MNVELNPVVMGVLRTPSRKLKKCLGRIGIEIKFVDLHKTGNVYSLRFLQKVLELWEVLTQEQNFNVQHQHNIRSNICLRNLKYFYLDKVFFFY